MRDRRGRIFCLAARVEIAERAVTGCAAALLFRALPLQRFGLAPQGVGFPPQARQLGALLVENGRIEQAARRQHET